MSFSHFSFGEREISFTGNVSGSVKALAIQAYGLLGTIQDDTSHSIVYPSQKRITELALTARGIVMRSAEEWAKHIMDSVAAGRVEDSPEARVRGTPDGFLSAMGDGYVLELYFGLPLTEIGERRATSAEGHPLQIMASYALLCIDQAIALLQEERHGESLDLLATAACVLGKASIWWGGEHGQSLVDIEQLLKNKRRSEEGHKNSKKRGEKEFIKTAWEEWVKDTSRYKNKAAFIRDMFEKTEHLEKNESVVSRWMLDWEKESGAMYMGSKYAARPRET